MDMASVERADLPYDHHKPLILAASSEAALQRARAALEQCDARIAGTVLVNAALDRLDAQASVGTVWLEIGEDGGAPLDALLDRVAGEVAQGRYAAIAALSADMLDPVTARIGDTPIDILVDPSPVERAAALAMASTAGAIPLRVNDVATDRSTEQLRQLSEEVNRIASMLARLSDGPGAAPSPIRPTQTGSVPPVSADTVRKVIRARRLRNRYFADHLFADPAWDMLLDLLQAELSHLRVPVSSLCIAASVPATTALRWLKTMVSEGLFIRRADPHDGRRVFVELAPDTRDALHRYFAEVEGIGAI